MSTMAGARFLCLHDLRGARGPGSRRRGDALSRRCSSASGRCAWRRVPLLATYVGVHTSDDRLGGATEEDFVRRERETRAFLEALGEDRPRGAAGRPIR